MTERLDIQEALREAVERTIAGTVETRGRAQEALDEVTGAVEGAVRGAEEGLRTRRRSVQAAVGDRLPATQEDVKAMTAELRRISRRLDSIEKRLANR